MIINEKSIVCDDCAIPYCEMGVDLVLPDQIWNDLAKDATILCANCICKRLAKNKSTTALLAWPDNYTYDI